MKLILLFRLLMVALGIFFAYCMVDLFFLEDERSQMVDYGQGYFYEKPKSDRLAN